MPYTRAATWVAFPFSPCSAAFTSIAIAPPHAPKLSCRSATTSPFTFFRSARTSTIGNGRMTLGRIRPTFSPSFRSASTASFAVSAAEFRMKSAASASSIRYPSTRS